jgi:hypothetical protein
MTKPVIITLEDEYYIVGDTEFIPNTRRRRPLAGASPVRVIAIDLPSPYSVAYFHRPPTPSHACSVQLVNCRGASINSRIAYHPDGIYFDLITVVEPSFMAWKLADVPMNDWFKLKKSNDNAKRISEVGLGTVSRPRTLLKIGDVWVTLATLIHDYVHASSPAPDSPGGWQRCGLTIYR